MSEQLKPIKLFPYILSFSQVAGASSVYTVEYNTLTYTHPKITTISKDNFTDFYSCAGGHLGSFDFAISLSSFDHDGLGRYVCFGFVSDYALSSNWLGIIVFELTYCCAFIGVIHFIIISVVHICDSH